MGIQLESNGDIIYVYIYIYIYYVYIIYISTVYLLNSTLHPPVIQDGKELSHQQMKISLDLMNQWDVTNEQNDTNPISI